MTRYYTRRRPVDAAQWVGTNLGTIEALVGDRATVKMCSEDGGGEPQLHIEGDEKMIHLTPGEDWVVVGDDGDLYVFNDDNFHTLHEADKETTA